MMKCIVLAGLVLLCGIGALLPVAAEPERTTVDYTTGVYGHTDFDCVDLRGHETLSWTTGSVTLAIDHPSEFIETGLAGFGSRSLVPDATVACLSDIEPSVLITFTPPIQWLQVDLGYADWLPQPRAYCWDEGVPWDEATADYVRVPESPLGDGDSYLVAIMAPSNQRIAACRLYGVVDNLHTYWEPVQ